MLKQYGLPDATRAFLALAAGLLLSLPVQAGTLVRIGTSVGDFTIELLDESAPVTVQNFLNYVRRGAYNQTYFHRVEQEFVVQGGAYRFQSFVGPVDVPTDPPIVNEFGASNVRGTVAMAKVDGDPNSATNQWFVNTRDNATALDGQNGGFTVFGTVLGDGMNVIETINALPAVTLGAKASRAPYITEAYTSPTEFVYMTAAVVDRYSAAAHVFEERSGLLFTSVNVNNGAEVWSLRLHLVENASNVVFRVQPDSILRLRGAFAGMASFSTTDNRLRIPELELNLSGRVQILRNVVLVQTDAANRLFTLESYES